MVVKKELAIVFGATGNMAFALGNVLIGLKKYSTDLKADLIVFEQGIADRDKKLINSILSCDFREYNFPKKNTLTNDTLKKFSELTFSRFECFNLLNEYKNVLWLDIDILIQKDIELLLAEKSTGISMLGGLKAGDDFTIEVKGLEKDKENFNAGIMYIQDNLPNYENLTEYCYSKAIEYSQYLKSADQGIINLMVKENNLDVHRLDWKFNSNPAFNNDYLDAIIVHTYCPEKMWNYWNIKEWEENDKAWRKMGGSAYRGKKFGWWERKFKNIPHPVKRTRAFIKYFQEKYL